MKLEPKDDQLRTAKVALSCSINHFFALLPHFLHGASLVAQTVTNVPVVREIWVQSLSQEDTPQKGMATHSSILA